MNSASPAQHVPSTPQVRKAAHIIESSSPLAIVPNYNVSTPRLADTRTSIPNHPSPQTGTNACSCDAAVPSTPSLSDKQESTKQYVRIPWRSLPLDHTPVLPRDCTTVLPCDHTPLSHSKPSKHCSPNFDQEVPTTPTSSHSTGIKEKTNVRFGRRTRLVRLDREPRRIIPTPESQHVASIDLFTDEEIFA